jgi:hypothetical protein
MKTEIEVNPRAGGGIETVDGVKVPLHLVSQRWVAGKFAGSYVVASLLAEWIASEKAAADAREATKAARAASNAAFLARPRLVVAKEGGE